MALTKIPVISREFYRVPVTITVDGVAIDPSALTVEAAIVTPPGTAPVDADWIAGDWETTSDGWLARALVGDSAADHPLTKDITYDAWFRFTDSPERPARLVGQILGT